MAISAVLFKSSPLATPETWMDATPATAAAADITAPKTAMLADGVLTTGTGSGGGGGGDYPVPTDGKTHIYINIPDGVPASGHSVYVRYWQSANDAVTVDWGDGSPTETFSGTAAANRGPHVYADCGEYEITLACATGTYAVMNGTIYGNITNDYYRRTLIKCIYFGADVTQFNNGPMQYSYALQKVTISAGESLSNNSFNECYLLKEVVLPDSLTSIGNSVFARCTSLTNLTIPKNVESIGTSAFQYCASLGEMHFKSTTPPILSNSNAFLSVPTDCIIYVPYSADHSVLAAYQSATNYPSSSTYTYMEE